MKQYISPECNCDNLKDTLKKINEILRDALEATPINISHELTIDDLPKHTMSIAEKQYKTQVNANVEVDKKPTICAKCRFYEFKPYPFSDGIGIIEYLCHLCHKPKINFITGESIKGNCFKNYGNCPDFEPRED